MTRSLLPPVHDLDDERALRFGDRELSYGELNRAAATVARRLRGADRAAVWAESTLETCIAVVGALAAGVPLVPLNPKLGAAELRHVLEDSCPDVVLGAPAGALPLPDPSPVLMEVDPHESAGELPVDDGGGEEPALIVYTSGTTGRPKGAVLPRRAVETNLDALARAWEWSGEDRLTHALPLFHVHGLVLGLLGPLRLGGALHHLVKFDAAAVAAAFQGGATLMFGVPTMYHRLAAELERDQALVAGLRRARLLVSGSAALAAPDFEAVERASGQRIVERYGLTETLMNTAVRAGGERRPGYVGEALEGVDLRLVGDNGEDIDAADDETIGELAVRGPNVFSGYLNRPEATGEALRDGWFFTGDLATRARDGYWRIVGRRSTDLIKTGGYKVGAVEVESALLEHAAVAEVAVTGTADPDLGERIVAWVVLDPAGGEASNDALADHVAGQLAPHKRPREVHFVDELPRNAMGKVVKAKLGE